MRQVAEGWVALAFLLVLGCGVDPHAEVGEHAHGHGEEPPRAVAAGDLPRPGSYSLPPLGDAADGAVLESDGRPARLHALFGERIVLLSFIYTRCPDAEGCPLALATFRSLVRALRDEPGLAEQLRLVSLSFDPENDRPEVMRRYGERFGTGDWHFLTTTGKEALEPILDAYGQHVVQESDAEGGALGSFSHVLRVFLIDRALRIRQVYSSAFLQPEALLVDVRTLLLEEGGTDGERVATPTAQPTLQGPGDVRVGYARSDYESRSRSLLARRGRPADLVSRLREPPLGLPPVPSFTDGPATQARVALGRRLFYDRRLSHNDTISCAMCHVPEQGFTSNETKTPVGIEGRSVRRNAPTLYNVAYVDRLFHDGREPRLEEQMLGPLLARNEMGNPAIGVVLEKLRRTDDYAQRFEAAFPERGLGLETLGMALAGYQRTLVSGGSPFDRWHYGGEPNAISGAAARGFALFTGEAGCAGCHHIGPEYALFSDGALHNTGVGFAASMGLTRDAGHTKRVQVAPGVSLPVDKAIIAQVSEPVAPDLGRYEVTLDPVDRWKYRTPTLRNVALSAPYMHDGSLATLSEVIDFYSRGGIPNPGLDPRIRPLALDAAERDALVAFLESLTGGDVDLLVADAFAAPVGDVGVAARETR